MNAKTRFNNLETQKSPDRIKAEAEELRADTFARDIREIKTRIREFYGAVDCVVFENISTAPMWAEGWFAYLLDGELPEVPEPEFEATEPEFEDTEPEETEENPDVEADPEEGLGFSDPAPEEFPETVPNDPV